MTNQPVSSAPTAVETHGLTKRFDDMIAVADLDITIETGEIFGLMGPNGAGKSTTLAMLATLLAPSSGTAHVFGVDVVAQPDHVRATIGVLFQEPSLDEQLTVRENLDLYGRFYHLTRSVREREIGRLLEFVEMLEWGEESVRILSPGLKRQVELIRALLHRPRLLILDEPTLGLDPRIRERMWSCVEQVNQESEATVLLATNYAEEAERLCHRIAILERGRLVAQGPVSELVRDDDGTLVELRVANPVRLAPEVRQLPHVRDVRIRGDRLEVQYAQETELPTLLAAAHRIGEAILDVRVRRRTLTDVFRQYTQDGHKPEEALTHVA